MARRRNRTERKPRHISVIVIILVAVFVVAMGWRLHGLRKQLETARFERDRYQEEVAKLKKEYEDLSADLQEGITEEKVEDIAHNELGMVRPDEYIFYNNGNTED